MLYLTKYFRPNPIPPSDRPGKTGPTGAVLLVDARHPGLENDKQALAWLSGLEIPLCIAATKTDRVTRSSRQKTLRAHETALGRSVLPVSAKRGDGLPAFWAALLAMVSAPAQTQDPKGLV